MLVGASLVWVALAVGLRVLSGGGAWQLGWFGSFGLGTVLWPMVALGYYSLTRLFGSDEERREELFDSALMTALVGVPALGIGFAWSLLVLGAARLLQSFGDAPSGGFLNFVMSVLALHVLAWGGAGLTQWAWSAWHHRDE